MTEMSIPAELLKSIGLFIGFVMMWWKFWYCRLLATTGNAKNNVSLHSVKTDNYEEDFIGFGHYGCGGGCAGAGSAAKL